MQQNQESNGNKKLMRDFKSPINIHMVRVRVRGSDMESLQGRVGLGTEGVVWCECYSF